MHFYWKKYRLQFKRPSGTSRGVLYFKDSWFLIAEHTSFSMPAVGECSIIENLSPDNLDTFESTLDQVCLALSKRTNLSELDLKSYPAIAFGLEQLMADIEVKGSKEFWQNEFVENNSGMRINGLIWMGDADYMKQQIREKLKSGFECLKMKIGAIDFKEELAILSSIREEFNAAELELRVDANGAFSANQALEKLKRLADLEIHSIEQPIRQGQWTEMAKLCEKSPLDIALDEELIGINDQQKRIDLLSNIHPKYIILKPSLIGGLKASTDWINASENQNIGWWITSALESNIGLNYITQYTYNKGVSMPQGLGTGSLYLNNVDSPLYIQGQFINHNRTNTWNLQPIIAS